MELDKALSEAVVLEAAENETYVSSFRIAKKVYKIIDHYKILDTESNIQAKVYIIMQQLGLKEGMLITRQQESAIMADTLEELVRRETCIESICMWLRCKFTHTTKAQVLMQQPRPLTTNEKVNLAELLSGLLEDTNKEVNQVLTTVVDKYESGEGTLQEVLTAELS